MALLSVPFLTRYRIRRKVLSFGPVAPEGVWEGLKARYEAAGGDWESLVNERLRKFDTADDFRDHKPTYYS